MRVFNFYCAPPQIWYFDQKVLSSRLSLIVESRWFKNKKSLLSKQEGKINNTDLSIPWMDIPFPNIKFQTTCLAINLKFLSHSLKNFFSF